MFQDCHSLLSVPNIFTTFNDTGDLHVLSSKITKRHNLQQLFHRCHALIEAPIINLTGTTSLFYAFEQCYNLRHIVFQGSSNTLVYLECAFFDCWSLQSISWFNTSSVVSFHKTFAFCRNLKTVPELDYSSVLTLYHCFWYCESLEYLPVMNTKKCVTFWYAFNNATNLKRIESIDFMSMSLTTFYISQSGKDENGNASAFGKYGVTRDLDSYNQHTTVWHENSWLFGNNTKLTYLLIKNLGYQKNCPPVLPFHTIPWGEGNDENRKSLIDSLITYSFDRATVGYDVVTIRLSTITKNILTPEEKSQIESKGYIIN